MQKLSVVGRHTSIIRILLLPQTLNSAIERREQATPDPEIASQDRRAGFYGCEGTDATFAIGGVAETFYAVPDCATDSLCQDRQWLAMLSNFMSDIIGEEGGKERWVMGGRECLTPIQKAPPKSLRATHGHGSLE